MGRTQPCEDGGRNWGTLPPAKNAKDYQKLEGTREDSSLQSLLGA